ncbi:MAG: cation-transporting P-type ATPase [Hyphomicrobiales bacterium]|nr:MAG: cation-transporting P-type ATPase [Hyphomicrobiales bacterium]
MDERGAGSGVIVLHDAVPGRLRVRVPGLKGDRGLRRALESALAATRAIRMASGSAATGTLLVLFDAEAEIAAILHAIEKALARAGSGRLAPEAGRRNETPWHVLPVEQALSRLRSSMGGLSSRSLSQRLRRYGENILPAIPARDRMEILVEQFKSLPVALLIGASALSAMTGGAADAIVVLSVVALNAGIGYYTEAQADRAVRALSKPMNGGVAVLREGRREIVAVESTAPGDVLDLRPGSIVAADARVVAAQGLMVNEATLTGESAPVRKSPEALQSSDVALADRANIVYRGTIVTGGSGLAVVVATGQNTEIGQVQRFIATATAPATPLQTQLDRLGGQLTLLAGGACALVFLVGLLRGYGLFATFKNAIALAVAAVPEGLPTLATTTLALGVREMRKQRVLVRRLDAVETLASVRVICLDKTGTLTFNRMSVAEAACGGAAYSFGEGGRDRFADGAPAELMKLGEIVALCNEASLKGGDALSSATEVALLDFAQGLGLDVARLRKNHPIERIAYRTERQMFMITLHRGPGGERLAAVKGSPESVLELCDRALVGRDEVPLTDEMRRGVEGENARLAGAGQRVLGAAYRSFSSDALDPQLDRYVFVGLVGLADPLRPGVAALLSKLRRAGVSPVMITGDQKATAAAIARQLDFGEGDLRIVDSEALANGWSHKDLREAPHVFARVTPGQKLEIVKALQAAGHVVAMTGDGVNDSPALKAADIGVAMGRSGSEAAREVAHIVLQDDNLDSLAPAIERGRATQANIRRAIRYLLATNTSEILLMLFAPIANLGQPLTAGQLLWINLVTDVAPALALGVEPPHYDVMCAPPAPPREDIIDRRGAMVLAREGALIAAGAFGAYVYGCSKYGVASPRPRAMCFVSLVTAQLLHALSCRSQTHGFASRALPSNHTLSAVIATSIALQGVAMLFPPLRRLLGVAPISLGDVSVALIAALAPFAVNEGAKRLAPVEPLTPPPNNGELRAAAP